MHEGLHRKEGKIQRSSEPSGLIYHFNKGNELWRSEKAKERRPRILGVVIMEGKHSEKRMEGKDSFVGF